MKLNVNLEKLNLFKDDKCDLVATNTEDGMLMAEVTFEGGKGTHKLYRSWLKLLP